MAHVDFKKELKEYYSPKPGMPELKEIPELQFIMVDGSGRPEGEAFQAAVGALYTIGYGVMFGRKKSGLDTFSMGPLEGLWWHEVGEEITIGNPDDWLWTAMMWMPDFVTPEEVAERVEEAKAKKPGPALDLVRLETLEEGLVVQIMHIGPYSEEPPNVDKMHEFAAAQGLVQKGKHHEIYLGDPRRAAPDKLRTILRHPVAPTVG